VEYLIWLLDQGCFLGLDRYPGRLTSSKARTRTLKALIDLGFADRLCPSHDGIIIRVMGELPGLLPTEEERLKINPYGFLYMKKVVFPDLASLGVPEKIINNLCVIGPRKFLENK